jgi:hypothetical protein
MKARLEYIGRMLLGDPTSPRMWNIIAPGSQWHKSSRTLEGLKQIGIIGGHHDQA